MSNYPYPPDRHDFDEEDYMNVSSAGDCTGLIPSAALTDDEFDSYTELYDFLPPDAAGIPRK